MIDFNKGTEQFNKFLGSEKKTTFLYDGTIYMLKYPDPIKGSVLGGSLSYKNNQFSEHIGSLIFKSCGFVTHETVLGTFTDKNGKDKIVVGCKDFTQYGGNLYEMKMLANQTNVNNEKTRDTIEAVYGIIDDCPLIIDNQSIINGFWDMFVVDALIGNRDRHLGNWGLFEQDGNVGFAPIYDCGSSLAAMLSDDDMGELVRNPSLFKNGVYNATSCYTMNGNRIFYHEIFRDPPPELSEAILRVAPRIDMEEIRNIVNSVEVMSDIRKEYLIKALDMRYEQILEPALNREVEKMPIKEKLAFNQKKADAHNAKLPPKEPSKGIER